MKLLIVGFNARPIAKSALEAGHEVGVIDYFGDMDLLLITKNCFSVLRQKPGETLHRELHRKPAEYLYILAEIMCDEQNDFDGILLGSSFDRYPEIVESFSKLGPELYANNSKRYELVRDKKKINELAENAGFIIPKLFAVRDFREAIEMGENLGYPIVTREDGGGGGAGIKLWESSEEITSYYEDKEKGPLWVQEFIDGKDASASVICSENGSRIISFNSQLMGDKKLGAPGPFSYCGNVTPLDIRNQLNTNDFYNSFSNIIHELLSNVNLLGSNGIDFVISNDKLYFMEINPRLQGSLECIQYSIDENIIKLHLDSFNNSSNIKNTKPKYKKWGFKGILFSNQESSFAVKKYPKSKTIVDRTHLNTILEYCDPFCSIVFSSKKLQNGYQKLYKTADEIISVNK
ncbi:MAG: ATP-grasp domain-containing protein [Asgard group archaeon]|nr:ATP-grasp domain-containing protein [Asgard group archaeon]